MTLVELKNYLSQMSKAGYGEECLYFVDEDEAEYFVTGVDTDGESSLLLTVEEEPNEACDIDTMYEALCELDDGDEHEAYLWNEESEVFMGIDDDWDTDDEELPYMNCMILEDDENSEGCNCQCCNGKRSNDDDEEEYEDEENEEEDEEYESSSDETLDDNYYANAVDD